MADEKFIRTEMLIGKENVDLLKGSHVAVFGIGGVGSYTTEALARAGVGQLTLIDADTVNESNINRQLIATINTIGRKKVEVAKEHIHEINPDAKINIYPIFFDEGTMDQIDFSSVDYIVDAIDSVKSKVALITLAKEKGIPIISSMGTGNKLDPTRFEVADISKTSVCPLARVTRKQLGLRGIKHLKTVYSKEDAITPLALSEGDNSRPIPASISFVPSVAGLIIAGEVIKDICGI
ncbi:MAG: tRNA threonylcarbamoyladenosine dehydratase [Clostridia bacterium]|nr:tRNA threonylcarbamoyladenosine dehydratase [Clostridia bacterium]